MVDWNRSCWVQSESLGLSFFLSWCIDLWLIRINRINVKAPFVPCLPTAVPLIGKFDLTFTSFLILMEHFSTGYCSSYITVAAVLVNIYRIMCVCPFFLTLLTLFALPLAERKKVSVQNNLFSVNNKGGFVKQLHHSSSLLHPKVNLIAYSNLVCKVWY